MWTASKWITKTFNLSSPSRSIFDTRSLEIILLFQNLTRLPLNSLLVPLCCAIWVDGNARTWQQVFVQLFLCSWVNIDQHWEVLAKATQCEHVVPRVPGHIWHQIKKLALIGCRVVDFFKTSSPNARFAILWASYDILAIWRNSAPYHHVFALRPEESLFDPYAAGWFVLN